MVCAEGEKHSFQGSSNDIIGAKCADPSPCYHYTSNWTSKLKRNSGVRSGGPDKVVQTGSPDKLPLMCPVYGGWFVPSLSG